MKIQKKEAKENIRALFISDDKEKVKVREC